MDILSVLVGVLMGVGVVFFGLAINARYIDWRKKQNWIRAGKEWKSTLQKMEDIGVNSIEFGAAAVEAAREGAFRDDNKIPDDELKEHCERISQAEILGELIDKRRQQERDNSKIKVERTRQKKIEDDERLTKERLA